MRRLILGAALAAAAASAIAQQPLAATRDRLLDTYAQARGLPDRCAVWQWMTSPAANAGGAETRKYVFLTTTHNLWLPFVQPAGGGRVSPAQQERLSDHIVRIDAVRDDGGSRCGGGEDNRLFGRFSQTGIDAVRNLGVGSAFGMFGPMNWRQSGDAAGPHKPFTGSRESDRARPRAQLHYFRFDRDAKVLARPEVEAVLDPRAFEIDLDYNWLHDSNPTCTYSGTVGHQRYRNLWGEPAGYPAVEFDYQPGGCGSARIGAGGVVDAWSYAPATTTERYVSIFGVGFDGDVAVWFHQAERGSGAIRAHAAQVLYVSANQINVKVPPALAPSAVVGPAYVHVVAGGRRTGFEAIRIE